MQFVKYIEIGFDVFDTVFFGIIQKRIKSKRQFPLYLKCYHS